MRRLLKEEDTDHLIDSNAVDTAQQSHCVVLVGENTELLIMMAAFGFSSQQHLLFKTWKRENGEQFV